MTPMDTQVEVKDDKLNFSCTDCLPAGVHSAEFWHGMISSTTSFSIYVCETKGI